MSIQTILINKNEYSLPSAIEFIKRNGFEVKKIDIDRNFYRFRQNDPKQYKTFYTKPIKKGVLFVFGNK